jgi:hypothetical protein
MIHEVYRYSLVSPGHLTGSNTIHEVYRYSLVYPGHLQEVIRYTKCTLLDVRGHRAARYCGELYHHWCTVLPHGES